MINARLALLALSPLLLLGATCVTNVEQKGPTGPWIVEVTNTGPDPVFGVTVRGSVEDANGTVVSGMFDETCPLNLMPEQKGYFIKPAVSNFESFGPNITLPLRIIPSAFAQGSIALLADGVVLHVLATYQEHRALLVEMRSNSPNTHYQVKVCAVLFSPSGETQEVVSTRPFLTSTFKPGDVTVFPVAFNSPIDGQVQIFASSFVSPDTDVVLDPSLLTIGVSRIVETERGRELQVVGEVENNTAADLESVQYQTYLKTSPTVRAIGHVASTGWSAWSQWGGYFDGTGFIPAGQKAPVAFSLLLDKDDSTRIEVAGVEGLTSPFTLSPLPVKNVSNRRLEADSIEVTATVSNPRSEGMQVPYICFNLRGNNDRLVGTSCRRNEWIEPNGALTLSQEVTELAPMRSVEVILYGYPGAKPVTVP